MRGRVFLAAAVGILGCGPSRPAPRPSDALERSARILRALDRLEADLHQSEAENNAFSDLVERHGRAEQIACKVTEEHVEEIHRLAVAQEVKLRQKRQARSLRKHKAVAQLAPRDGRGYTLTRTVR